MQRSAIKTPQALLFDPADGEERIRSPNEGAGCGFPCGRSIVKNAFLRVAAICAALAVPAAAWAAEGFATANVNMRSGPSTRYPAVTLIPAGESVEIHGCLADRPWCDVSFYGGRGWVAGQYVQAAYRSRFGHPAPDVVARYEARAVEVVRSDRCGAWTWPADDAESPFCERTRARRYWHHGAPPPEP